jgi:hypothetical protein
VAHCFRCGVYIDPKAQAFNREVEVGSSSGFSTGFGRNSSPRISSRHYRAFRQLCQSCAAKDDKASAAATGCMVVFGAVLVVGICVALVYQQSQPQPRQGVLLPTLVQQPPPPATVGPQVSSQAGPHNPSPSANATHQNSRVERNARTRKTSDLPTTTSSSGENVIAGKGDAAAQWSIFKEPHKAKHTWASSAAKAYTDGCVKGLTRGYGTARTPMQVQYVCECKALVPSARRIARRSNTRWVGWPEFP